MKSLILVLCMSTHGILADVIKPPSTMRRYKSETTINEQLFIYSVLDRGVLWSDRPNDQFTISKVYMLDYKNHQQYIAPEDLLRNDAQRKCNELGRIDVDERQNSRFHLDTFLGNNSYFHSAPATIAGYTCHVVLNSIRD